MKSLKPDRLFLVQLFFAALTAMCLTLCIIYAAEAKRHVNPNVVYVAPKIITNTHLFSEQELIAATSHIEGIMSTERVDFTQVSAQLTGVNDATVKVVYVDEHHFELNRLPLSDGSFVAADSVVVNVSLAWFLYGSLDVINQTLNIYNQTFRIAGIVEQKNVSKNDLCVWVVKPPADNKTADIRGFWIRPDIYIRLDSVSAAADIVTRTGRNPLDYTITDLNTYIGNIALKYKLLFFLSGLWSTICVVFRARHWISQQDNLLSVKRGEIVRLVILCAVSLATIAGILFLIRFEFWMPGATGATGNESAVKKIVQALINANHFPHTNYLPDSLKNLIQLNDKSLWAFVGGVTGLVLFAVMAWARGGKNRNRIGG